MSIPKFPEDHVESIARALADERTHAQFDDLFQRLGLDAPSSKEGAKWFRIREALVQRQKRDRVGNYVGAFIQAVMKPVNFVDVPERFETTRTSLNKVIAFSGLQLSEEGKLAAVKAARTLDEAEALAAALRAKLLQRRVHPEVLRCCRAELMDGNYFHAVLEAVKSVCEAIRRKTGLTKDMGDLFQPAFGGKTPLLALNSLQTQTEQMEQSGFVSLLVGLGAFRHPTAHALKVGWPVSEEDALDLLSLVSYIHRRLERAVRTHHPLNAN